MQGERCDDIEMPAHMRIDWQNIHRIAALACCLSLLTASFPLSSPGIAIRFHRPPITVSSVWSTATFDYDFVTGGVGSTHFNDCLHYVVNAKRSITRVDFLFALSTPRGKFRGRALPVSVVYRTVATIAKSEKMAACRRYGYEDGTWGLRLIAWVNEVDFSDGTIWRAPTSHNLRLIISAQLSQQ